MKKYILLLFTLILSLPLLAQLEVKEGSFKEVPGFVNINTEKMYDDNDKPYAVLKIKTENISSKERHELGFKGDAQTFFEVEYKDGEVWLYISYYATYIKISHEEYSSTEFHFPYDMKPKCGYELTLVNKTSNNSPGSGSLTITTTPEDGATISLNGKVLSQKTPYLNDMIAIGKYEVTVSKYGFESATKEVVIQDGITTNLNVEMPYKYGGIRIISEPAQAIVLIDDKQYGFTPLILDSIRYGTHEIKVKKDKHKTYSKRFEIKNSDILDFDVVLENYPDGVINGVFSVSPTKKVYFSQGNLQYKASTKTWRFAEHQWDFIGYQDKTRYGTVFDYGIVYDNGIKSNNALISPTYDGWIDLFGWGTGNNPTNTSKSSDSYKVFSDWGLNINTNGLNNKWRTLSKDEWLYVFEKRYTDSGIRYAKAFVNGVNGIILLPDNWNVNDYVLYNTNSADSYFNSNMISLSNWVNKLESKGAVFLPTAGSRLNTIISVVNRGFYWSATPYTGDEAYKVFFMDGDFSAIKSSTRRDGQSVRLVCDVE